ncbi:MAG: cytochrome C oxidase subunit IV family protein [Bdellovibrionaceae bacterium]|nr:cytochrome C oxidase subunit IV family protein [Pseudobdellovibrionaceae bacterium]NUM59679.1 cytochrome C oxidase subunit IV family protein [Pseudobdellovibrionaceae bacterium]
MAANNHSEHQSAGHGHHIIPAEIYKKVALALFVLTLLTVGFHYLFHSVMHGSVLAAPVAFLIAAVKASLVLMFFMGLKYDSVDNRIIFALGFFFLFVLIFFSALDIWTRVAVTSTL